MLSPKITSQFKNGFLAVPKRPTERHSGEPWLQGPRYVTFLSLCYVMVRDGRKRQVCVGVGVDIALHNDRCVALARGYAPLAVGLSALSDLLGLAI